MELNIYEETILRRLVAARRPLTTSQIAEKLKISWETSRKYLNRLYRKKLISKKRQGRRIYWGLK